MTRTPDQFIHHATALIRDQLAQPEAPDTVDVHRDGQWWFEVPAPPRRHECQAHTVAYTEGSTFGIVARCACGALGTPDSDTWIERNSRINFQIDFSHGSGERTPWTITAVWVITAVITGGFLFVGFASNSTLLALVMCGAAIQGWVGAGLIVTAIRDRYRRWAVLSHRKLADLPPCRE